MSGTPRVLKTCDAGKFIQTSRRHSHGASAWQATLQRFEMTMSPLNVRMVSIALPSPKTACVEWPGPGRRRSVRAVVGPMVNGKSERSDPLKLFALSSKPTWLASVNRIVPEGELMSYRPFFASTPAYSTLPLTDRTPRRSHDTLDSSTSPLIVPRSSARALSPFARIMPLTLLAFRSECAEASVRSTSPDTDLAASSLGVDAVVTVPLMVSARTAPCTALTFTLPDTDFT